MGRLARSDPSSGAPLRRRRHVVALALGVVAFGAVLLATPSPAATTMHVPTVLEAWYQAAPASSAAGDAGLELPADSASAYSAGSLHVGVKAGTEDARAYLGLDPSALPPDREVASVTLVLPINTSDGTAFPESATIDVCHAPDPGPGVEGSLAPPPAVDCSLAVRAAYEDEPVPQFVADITSFGPALRSGGLAVLPSGAASAGNATWHVALHKAEHAPSRELAIHAEVELVPARAEPAVVAPPRPTSTPVETATGVVDERPAFSDIADTTRHVAPPPAEPAPLLGGNRSVALPPVQTASAEDAGFAYPAVLVLPLALLILGIVLGTSLGRDPRVVLVGADEEA